MEQLKFTIRVLGTLAAFRLEDKSVTQTLRGYSESMTQAVILGRLKTGDRIKVTLDDRAIGFVEYTRLDTRRWVDVDLSDARRGGFDTIADLEKALHRAGFRFQPMDRYKLYRHQFQWLQEA